MSYRPKLKCDNELTVVDESGKSVPSAVTLLKTGEIDISYPRYTVFDDEVLDSLIPLINNSDLARVFKMSRMITNTENRLMNRDGNVPHISSTLRDELGYTRNNFALFMSRMTKLKVLMTFLSYTDEGKKYNAIFINPFLFKKSRAFSAKMLAFPPNFNQI